MLDLDFSDVAAKSKFVVFRPSAPSPLGGNWKGDHVRRLVIIAAVGRLRLCPSSPGAEIRSSCGYLQAG
jgi:hypothetical protein